MTWFAFQGLNSGKAINLAGVQEKTATAEGFHGYATEAQAEANPNSVNIITQGFADLFITDYSAAVKEGAQPGGPNNITTAGGAANAAVQGATGVSFSSIQNALSAFYTELTNVKMWRSLGWLALGLVLMFTGIGLWIGPAAARSGPVEVLGNVARRAYG